MENLKQFENKETLNFDIDLATEDDLDKINAIENRPEEHLDMIKLQKKGAGNFFVVRTKNKISGYISLYFDHQSAHFSDMKGPFLEDLMVGQEFRKKGIGKILLQKCEEDIKNRDEKELTLAVLSDNKEAIDFYEKNGYSEIPDTQFESPKKEDQKEIVHGHYYKKELA